MFNDVSEEKPNYRKTILWALAFFAAMFGIPIIGYQMAFPQVMIMAGMVFAMLLLIPMVRSSMKENAKHGLASNALRAYNRRMFIWSFAYIVALFFSIWVYNSYAPQGPALWVIAVLPALPIFYFIWTMGRYLQDESDEYIRMKNVGVGIIATGFLLGIAALWGFLETFELVPHIPSWMAVPVWAFGLGLGQCVNKIRGL